MSLPLPVEVGVCLVVKGALHSLSYAGVFGPLAGRSEFESPRFCMRDNRAVRKHWQTPQNHVKGMTARQHVVN